MRHDPALPRAGVVSSQGSIDQSSPGGDQGDQLETDKTKGGIMIERILLHHQTQTFSPYIKDGRREQMILSYFYVNDVVSWDHVRGNNDFLEKV